MPNMISNIGTVHAVAIMAQKRRGVAIRVVYGSARNYTLCILQRDDN